MTNERTPPENAPDPAQGPLADAQFEAVFGAWQSAAMTLQRTHDNLRYEVKRLTDEVEAKNQQLAKKNRLADLGQMAAHVAHELRNSLVPLTLYLSLLRRQVKADNSEQMALVDRIYSGLEDAQKTVTDLLQFTIDKDVEYHTVELDTMVQDICGDLSPQLEAQRVNAQVDIPHNFCLRGDQGMLRRAILNLVLNAIDVMPAGGDIVVTACPGARGVDIEVADSGPGIAEATRSQVFEPFFTTKQDGTGLGLAIVQRIAEAHGGNVEVANCPEGGAAFTISIPSTETKRAA